ncbi:MAG: outer membrane protein assembly factor BamD [Pseudomonadota bacterium]
MIASKNTHILFARTCAPLVLSVVLAGCSAGDDVLRASEDTPANVLYEQAQSAQSGGDLERAALIYNEVERLYPTSQLAKRSIINSAYVSYEADQFDLAILSAQRYLDFYPSDKDAPYAQYLIAVSHYDQITDVGRDQARTAQALQALRELVNRYPESEYAREGQIKLELTLDHLAGKEMEIGRFYLKRANYVAAINRFQNVIERYQTTSHVEEAMHRLVEAYLALGINGEAQAVASVLGYNFPGSPWYVDSYALLTGRNLAPREEEGSWISKVWGRVFKGDWL